MGMPGTARPGSRMAGRPASSLGSAVQQAGVGAAVDLKVADRPLTRSGLQGMPSSYGAQRRTVQDYSFYSSMVHSKIKELQEEIQRSEGEIQHIEKEKRLHKSLVAKYDDLEAQVRELEGELADHNLAHDKHRSGKSPRDFAVGIEPIQKNIDDLKAQLDAVFLERSRYDEQLQLLDASARDLLQQQDTVVQSLSPLQRRQYAGLMQENETLKGHASEMQGRLFQLAGAVAKYQQVLENDTYRQEWTLLESQLRRLERKRDDLEEERRISELDPKELQRKLLERVKEDTNRFKDVKAQSDAVGAENRELVSKLTSVARLLEVRRKSGEEQAQAAAEQAEKMKQLRARDGHMEQFIGGYDEAEAEWLQKKEESAQTVVALLEHISENLQRSEMLPSKERVEDMKEELDFKDKQLGASKATMNNLQGQLEVRRKELAKLENLDGRIDKEIAGLRSRTERLETEAEALRDIDALHHDHGRVMSWLQDALRTHSLREQSGEFLAREATRDYGATKLSEEDNKVMADTLRLEDRMQKLAQQEFELREFIDSRAADTFYDLLRDRCMEMASELSNLHAESALRA